MSNQRLQQQKLLLEQDIQTKLLQARINEKKLERKEIT